MGTADLFENIQHSYIEIIPYERYLAISSGFAKENSEMDKKSYERLLIGIGQVLAEARVSSGMTQGELGEKLDKVQSAVAKIERAPSPNVALRVIHETASALGMNLSEVFARAEALVGIESKHKTKESSKKGLSRETRRVISDIVSTNLQKTNDEIIRQLTSIDT